MNLIDDAKIDLESKLIENDDDGEVIKPRRSGRVKTSTQNPNDYDYTDDSFKTKLPRRKYAPKPHSDDVDQNEIPDVGEKHGLEEDASQFETCSIKFKLNAIEPHWKMRKFIKKVTKISTYVQHFGSLAMNMYVRYYIQHYGHFDNGVSLPMIYNTAISSFLGITKTEKRSIPADDCQDAFDGIKELHFEGVNKMYFVGFSDIRSDLARQLETAALNHLEHWHNFLTRWVKRQIFIHELNHGKLGNNYFYHVVAYITKSTPVDMSNLTKEFVERIEFYKNLVLHLPPKPWLQWRGHLVIIYFLLKDADDDTMPRDVVQKSEPHKFCLLPEFSVKLKHFNITYSILKEIDFWLNNHDNSALTEKQLWSHYFPNTDETLKGKAVQCNYNYKNNLRSDGVGVSLFVEDTSKPAKPPEVKSRKKKKIVPATFLLPHQRADASTRQVHIDPGARMIFTATVVLGNERHIIKMSNQEYHHLRRSKQFDNWTNVKLGRIIDMKDYKSVKFSTKTTNTEAVDKYIQHSYRFFYPTYFFYASHLYLNRVFSQFVAGQRALRKLVNRIVGKGSGKVICAIGNWDGSTARGHLSVPNKAWRRLLATVPGVVIVPIDEYNTTKTCAVCGGYFLSEVEMMKIITVGNPHALRLCMGDHGVKTPPKKASSRLIGGTVVGRDDNATRNMGKKYDALCNEVECPAHLQNPYAAAGGYGDGIA